MARGKSGSSGKARSTISGRYIKKATAKKNPRTSVIEKKYTVRNQKT